MQLIHHLRVEGKERSARPLLVGGGHALYYAAVALSYIACSSTAHGLHGDRGESSSEPRRRFVDSSSPPSGADGDVGNKGLSAKQLHPVFLSIPTLAKKAIKMGKGLSFLAIPLHLCQSAPVSSLR